MLVEALLDLVRDVLERVHVRVAAGLQLRVQHRTVLQRDLEGARARVERAALLVRVPEDLDLRRPVLDQARELGIPGVVPSSVTILHKNPR